MPANPIRSINFQCDTRMHDAIHAAARTQERSASALIRLAVRSFLSDYRLPPERPLSPRRKAPSKQVTVPT
jgi:hypothetical protein